MDQQYFDEDVDHANLLDADPVGDWDGDDEYFDISLYLDDKCFDEDVDERADPLDADPVSDREGDDEYFWY